MPEKPSVMGKARTVKAEILMYVLPIVIVGLVAMAGIIFKYVGSTFEEQLTTTSLRNAQEVADSVSDWLDKRMLETQTAANIPAAKNLKNAPDAMNEAASTNSPTRKART